MGAAAAAPLGCTTREEEEKRLKMNGSQKLNPFPTQPRLLNSESCSSRYSQKTEQSPLGGFPAGTLMLFEALREEYLHDMLAILLGRLFRFSGGRGKPSTLVDKDEGLRKNRDENIKHYGQPTLLVYDMTRIPNDLPLFLSYGGADALSDVKNVQRLLEILKDHDAGKLRHYVEHLVLGVRTEISGSILRHTHDAKVEKKNEEKAIMIDGYLQITKLDEYIYH
ncbi:hypothetical protein Fmac_020677 [Flemingia macrophylla]|uniref:Uncharacterized protein n=1 Tax=Flemingia macrophylla TaxID=520843 RepID=A0ABD1LUR7_9FABA